MELQKCVRCKKRPATVFISRIENNVKKTGGLCLLCAKQLGIKQVEDATNALGLNEEELKVLYNELEEFDGDILGGALTAQESSDDTGAVPVLDFNKIFENIGFPFAPLQGKAGGERNAKDKKKGEKKAEEEKKFLRAYATDLTEKARLGKSDRIIGRDKELERVIQILCRRQKNNPCLIGEPGVGKTAVAEALAVKILNKDVPYKLRNPYIENFF